MMYVPTSFDLQVSARTLAQEARGEPEDGQVAVAWVFKNRLISGRWGHTLSSVCLWNWRINNQEGQGFQFSGWRGQDANFAYACGLRDEDPLLLSMQRVISDVLDSGNDTTGGALFYYNPDVVSPGWAPTMRFLVQIGHHRFLTDQPAAPVLTS